MDKKWKKKFIELSLKTIEKEVLFIRNYLRALEEEETNPCVHEWHADQDNYCNFCVKCGARQEIYYDPPYEDVPINGDTPNDD